ncbi:antigen-presenting glycoprotein CD1d-like [Tiliqua scincoides]|uniref:antigen-presenting glycoprotein CD1d-like n=1 Tax=Tiliqua scincoides TaxID=71010 RepID=UPI0034635816
MNVNGQWKYPLIILLSPVRMLLLSFWVCRISSAAFPLPEGHHALRILQTTMFQNPSITDFEIIALLGDVETHTVESHTGKISFLQPWANSSLTPIEWKRLEKVAKIYLIGFNQTVHNIIQALNISYPAVAQSLMFCEIQPNGTTRGYYDAAANRKPLVIFSADAGVWAAQKKDPAALSIAHYLNQNTGTLATLRSLFSQCIKVLKTFLQTGKATVERQELPVAVVFARESPTGSGSLLLVCRVTGFYPRPIKVAWLQDEEGMPDNSMVNTTQILPNHDLTYQIRSSLVIPPAGTHRYSCKVEHSSLGGKSLVIPWERGENLKTGVTAGSICGGVIVVSIATAAFYWWYKKHREYEDVNRAPAVV